MYFVSSGGKSNCSLKILGGFSNDFYQTILLKKLINFNASPSSFKGLTRMYTEDSPIRRVINWQNAPGCNLVKIFKYIVESHISMSDSFNVKKLFLYLKLNNSVP